MFFRKIGISLCVCMLVITTSSKAVKGKEDCNSVKSSDIADFYKEKKNSIDVLAVGDSNLYRAIVPQLLWHDRHITSYVLASASQSPWLTYYLLCDALTYQTPKVVILDPYELFRTGNSVSSRYCKVINAMHDFPVKEQAIYNVDTSFTVHEKKGMLMTAIAQVVLDVYPEIYAILNKGEKPPVKYSTTKGFYLNVTKNPYEGTMNYMNTNKGYPILEKNKKYYDDILQLCKKKGIHVLIVKIPTATDWSLQQHNETAEYAKANDIPFLDLNYMKGSDEIDWSNDTKDHGTHMNVYGAYKVSDAIGRYLNEHYKLSNTTDKAVMKSYDTSYTAFMKKKEQMIDHKIKGDDH